MRVRTAVATGAVTIPLLLGTAGIALAAPPPPPAHPAAPSAASAARSAAVTYEVATYTSDIPGAGTDGYVWVMLHGSKGSSNWLYLDNSHNNFERNQTDRFYFTLSDLGSLKSVDVYFNRAGLSADWHLGQVTVAGTVFPANRWFTESGTQVNLPHA